MARIFDASAGTRPTAWALTRASANGTYFNSSGVLTTATTNAERLDYIYNGTSWVLGGLLYEPARTNLMIQSGNIPSASWTKAGVTATQSGTTIDGTSLWCVNTEGTTTAVHGSYDPTTVTLAAVFTVSAYVKAGTRRLVVLEPNISSSVYWGIVIDTVSWTVTTYKTSTPVIAASSITPAGSGIYRVSVTGSNASGTSFFPVFGGTSSATGVGGYNAGYAGTSSTMIGWGFQLEVGSSPSSVLPTTTASVTRATDSASFTLAGAATSLTFTFDDASTQTVGSLTGGATYTIPTTLNRSRILYIDDNTASGSPFMFPRRRTYLRR